MLLSRPGRPRTLVLIGRIVNLCGMFFDGTDFVHISRHGRHRRDVLEEALGGLGPHGRVDKHWTFGNFSVLSFRGILVSQSRHVRTSVGFFDGFAARWLFFIVG